MTSIELLIEQITLEYKKYLPDWEFPDKERYVEMHKQEIIDAAERWKGTDFAEQYYQETFKKFTLMDETPGAPASDRILLNETKEEFLPKVTDGIFDFVCTTPDCPHCEEDRRQMEDDDDYPEIEGTIAICEDMYINGPQYIPEISDEEILKAAKECRFEDFDISVGSFELGARWYREHLKFKQIKKD